jgi:hypothetical protein
MTQLRLGVDKPLADPGALELGDGSEHRQHEFRDPVAAAVAAQVEQPQVDPAGAERVDSTKSCSSFQPCPEAFDPALLLVERNSFLGLGL